jgi:hypothetical protein
MQNCGSTPLGELQMKDKLRARARSVFESIRDDAAQLENYKMSFGDKDKLRKEEDAVQLQVIAQDENERCNLVEFIIANRGYQEENIPQEKARLLKFYDIELLRQIKQSIENRVK